MKKEHYITITIAGLALFILSASLSWFIFGKVMNRNVATTTKETPKLTSLTSTKPQRHLPLETASRTQACPINGEMYSEKEKAIWETRRPLAVMIENHQEARPQSGLSYADVVYETVAEGGITRFMGVFYCGITGGNINLAPVRSARTYFLPWVLEYDALYNHVGGAGQCNDDTVDERAKALCQIDEYGIKDMDQFGISFPTCFRNYDRLDHAVATEHTMVCQTDKLTKLAADRGWTNVDAKGVSWDKKFTSWKFKDDAKEADRGTTATISFVLWKGYEKDYGVTWKYDATTNSYKRENGGVPHTDLETGEQLTAKAVVIMFAKETGPVDDHMHLLYGNIGSGDGILFQDGKAEKITWQKQDRSARTKFLAGGKEVNLNRGPIWVEMLAIGTPVTY